MSNLPPTSTPSAPWPVESLALAMERFNRTVLANPWIPQKPTSKQAQFLISPAKEALYGGAAGGGKSSALLMGAAQDVETAGYAALILRRTFADLSLPGALIARSKDWWSGKAKWNGQDHKWTFPSGAVVQFGYCVHPGDERRYKSSEFQFIAVDEATELLPAAYRFLFSRLRRPLGFPVPIRMRTGSNPGGPGHD